MTVWGCAYWVLLVFGPSVNNVSSHQIGKFLVTVPEGAVVKLTDLRRRDAEVITCDGQEISVIVKAGRTADVFSDLTRRVEPYIEGPGSTVDRTVFTPVACPGYSGMYALAGHMAKGRFLVQYAVIELSGGGAEADCPV